MSSIAPVEALLSINPESIPDVNHRDFSMYGTNAIKTLPILWNIKRGHLSRI